MNRMQTAAVRIGSVTIGDSNPIAIQSMCSTKTSDVSATVRQILELEKEGCDIIRVAVPDEASAEAIPAIKEKIHIPLVADIHFDYRLALSSIRNGVDKIRINPGNIGSEKRLEAVVDAAAGRGIPIRVGVNSGSLEKKFLAEHGGHVTARGLVDSALEKVSMIRNMGYDNTVISIKSSDVAMSIRAHEIIRDLTDRPLHVGITEAGTVKEGSIKSAVGLGSILAQGIGDTVRVSLTGDVKEEVRTARIILRSLGLIKEGIEMVSCPTCGRTCIDLAGLADRVYELIHMPQYAGLNIKVACMGCTVNGPGEAAEADLGICGGSGEGLIIRKGQIIKKVKEEHLLDAFRAELDEFKIS